MKPIAVPSYNSLLQKIHDLFKEQLEALDIRPYVDVLRNLRGKGSIQGVYLIFDETGCPHYVGKGQDVRARLLYHASPGGDLVQQFLAAEGFSFFPKKAHRCECGKLIECSYGSERIEDNRPVVARRIQAKILSEFKAAIISYDKPDTGLPLGLRELERLVQYMLVPKIGKFQHRTKGWIPISEHVARHPIPKDILKDLDQEEENEVKEEEKP